MTVFMLILCFLLILFAFVGISKVGNDADEAMYLARKLEMQIDTLRLKVDAQETILAEEMAKNEDLKYRLIAIQNTYVRIKRDNENLAHKLIKGDINGKDDEKAG